MCMAKGGGKELAKGGQKKMANAGEKKGDKGAGKGKGNWLASHHTFQKGRYAKHGRRWSVRHQRMLELIPNTGISRALELGGGTEPIIKRLNDDVEKFGISIRG